jgi:hypothetical protein
MDISFPVFLQKKVDYAKKANPAKRACPSSQDPVPEEKILEQQAEHQAGSLSIAGF